MNQEGHTRSISFSCFLGVTLREDWVSDWVSACDSLISLVLIRACQSPRAMKPVSQPAIPDPNRERRAYACAPVGRFDRCAPRLQLNSLTAFRTSVQISGGKRKTMPEAVVRRLRRASIRAQLG